MTRPFNRNASVDVGHVQRVGGSDFGILGVELVPVRVGLLALGDRRPDQVDVRTGWKEDLYRSLGVSPELVVVSLGPSRKPLHTGRKGIAAELKLHG